MNKLLFCLCISFFFISIQTNAQTDSLVMKNKNYLIGEIKSMERGVLVIKTAYSKDNFRVKWNEIQAIYSESLFITSTKDSKRLYGKISSPEAGYLTITPVDKEEVSYPVGDVLYIKSMERGFLDRINAGIDLGFTFTRARNQRQFTTRSHIDYLSQYWSFSAAINNLRTKQDEVENIERGDGNLTAVYIPGNSWLTLARMEYLYNNQQLINLRINTLLGVGQDFIRSNSLYWRVFGGLAFNNEDFAGEVDNLQSTELFLASELNIFDMGDFSILTNIFVYPSLTEENRLRVDYRMDLKYDLPLDFYIKSGLTLNYDNRSIQFTRTTDYIIQTTLGWSW
jgi:hypothetical protein